MADPTWDDTEPAEAPPAWEDTVPVDTGPTAAPVTAATTGILNGGTLNFAPALGAFGKTAMDAISGVNGPLAGGDIDDLVDEYRNHRDKLKDDFAKAAAAHPKIALASNMIGGAATLSPLGKAAMTAPGLAATGATAGVGATDINSLEDIPTAAKNAAIGAGTSLAAGKVVQAAAPYVGKALAPVGNALKSAAGAVSDWVGDSAGDLAVKATGATGREADNFVEGTGRELLDKNIVNFGSSPADVAENAQAAIDTAEATKKGVIQKLPGTTVDRNTVLDYIRGKIAAFSGDESKTGLVKSLGNVASDIEAQIPGSATDVAAEDATDAALGSEVQLEKAEEIRGGFDKSAKWDSNTDAPTREANKIAANAYREAGENAISDADSELGVAYKAAKTTQHMMIPVQEAAARRAGVLAQSPLGGLGDVAAAAVEGAPGVVGRRMLGPRLASMAAVSADQLSKVVGATPGVFGKFAPVLQSAAQRGGASLGATDYILQQTNQEYRDQRNKVFQPDEDHQTILGGASVGGRSPAEGDQ